MWLRLRSHLNRIVGGWFIGRANLLLKRLVVDEHIDVTKFVVETSEDEASCYEALLRFTAKINKRHRPSVLNWER